MQHPLADKGRTAVPPSPTGGKGNTWGSGRAGHAGGQVPGRLHLEHTEVRVLPSPYPHPGPSTTTIPLNTADPDGGFVLNVEDASYDGSTPVSKTGSGGSIPPASVRRTNRCSPQKAPPASLRRIPGRSKAALKDPASGRFPFPSQGWNGEIQGTAPGRRLRMPVHSSRKSEKGGRPWDIRPTPQLIDRFACQTMTGLGSSSSDTYR